MVQDDIIEQLFRKIRNKHKTFQIMSKKKIVGHSLSIGRPGYGKTSGNRREVELRWELNHKIFCLYDAGRMDMALFMFPSISAFWKKPKLEGRKIVSARPYPTELLYPVTKHIPQKLPLNGVPFTIAVSDLDEQDIAALTGFQSKEVIKGMMNYMENYVTDETTPDDYVNIMASALKKVGDIDGIKPSHHGAKKLKYDVFQPLINEGILSSKKASTAIDVLDKIKDRHTISTLVLRHCPQKLWGFLVHYFMNHIYKDLTGIGGASRTKTTTTIVLNEVADLLVTGDDESGESGAAISRMIEKIAKQSRGANLYMLLDTQLPQELPDIKNIMQRIYVYNSSRVEVEAAMEIMGISTRTGMMTNDDIYIIPFLPRGWYYLFDKEGVSVHKQIWTRSRSYMDGDEFYEVYDRVFGKASYVSITKQLQELKEERKRSQAVWELKKEIEAQTDDDEEQELNEEEENSDPSEESEGASGGSDAKTPDARDLTQEIVTLSQKEPVNPPAPQGKPAKKKIDWSLAKKVLTTI